MLRFTKKSAKCSSYMDQRTAFDINSGAEG